MDFGGAGKWLRLVVDDTGGYAAVKSVAVQGSGSSSWQQLTNSWGATWEISSAPTPPLTFKVGLHPDCFGHIPLSSGATSRTAVLAVGVSLGAMPCLYIAEQTYYCP
jgi:hypothetical protein